MQSLAPIDIVPPIIQVSPEARSFLESFPEEIQSELFKRTSNINRKHKEMSRSAIYIGLDLLFVKHKIGHGNYLPYVDACVDAGRRMAQKYTSVALVFGSRINQVEHLPLTVLIELARHNDKELTELVLRSYADGRKLQDFDVASLARSLERNGGKSDDVDIPTIVDAILNLVYEDAAAALFALKTIKALDLHGPLKRLPARDFDVLCRRLQNACNRKKRLADISENKTGAIANEQR